jgi:hypothetical protein
MTVRIIKKAQRESRAVETTKPQDRSWRRWIRNKPLTPAAARLALAQIFKTI